MMEQTADALRNDARATLRRAISEKAFLQQIVTFARLTGWLAYHTFDSRKSVPGFPDLVLVKGARIVYAELKREDGRLSQEQERWRDAITAAGGDWRLWKPSMWDEIERTLKGAEQ